MANEEFTPLGELLLQDNEKIKKLKTLYMHEDKYADILGPIEHAVALFYHDNRKLKDKDVIKAIKNIKLNYVKGLEYFNEPIAKEMMLAASMALKDFKITHHEFLLALSYILWSIDNRSWMQHNRAYLDWLLDFFGMANKNERAKLHKRYDGLGEKLGIEEERIEAMKNNYEEVKLSKEDHEFSFQNSSYFSMSGNEKCDCFLKCKSEYEKQEILLDLMQQIDCHMDNGKFNEAIAMLDKINDAEMEQRITEVLYSMKTECLICMKNYDEAEQIVQQLIDMNKDYPMSYFHRALIQYYKTNFKEALEHVDKSIAIAEKVDMKHPQYYVLKAKILKEFNNPEYEKFEKLSQKVMEENKEQVKKLSNNYKSV